MARFAKYYVYEHYIPGKSLPFYVGKGTGKRAWVKTSRSVWWKNIASKYEIVVKIVYNNLNEPLAKMLETILIEQYGRKCDGTGCLINLTTGGEGISGYRHTSEAKEKIGMSLRGKKLTSEHKQLLSSLAKARICTEDEKDRLRKLNIGRKLSSAHKEKIGNSHRGKTRSDIAKLNLSMGQGVKLVKLIHFDGTIESVLNRAEFTRKYNLGNASHVSSVARGELKSYKGWKLLREQDA